MRYTVNYCKVPYKEVLREGHWLFRPFLFLVLTVIKTFRIRTPYSMDVPPVESLLDLKVEATDLESDLIDPIKPVDQQLHDLGFVRGSVLGLNDLYSNTRYSMAVYRSDDGESIAWLRYSLSPHLANHLRVPRIAFYSLGPSGQVIVTTSTAHDLDDPPDWNAEHHWKMDTEMLWSLHRQRVTEILGNARPLVANDDASMMQLLQHTHEEWVEFQLGRGVYVIPESKVATSENTAVEGTTTDSLELTQNPFVLPSASTAASPVSPNDSNPTSPVAASTPRGEASATINPFAANPAISSTTAEDEGDAMPFGTARLTDQQRAELQPVIDAVRAQEQKQTGWLSKLVLLALSVGFFVWLGAWAWDLKLVLMLVPILFVHEMGHWIAMKVFGYRNVQMFFIPLLGAAVSGRHYRVDGWKKALVSLAGPLPSIVLGIALGVAGVWSQTDWITHAALLTLFLNLLNLLPFLPLDGGWVAHTTLFSRSYALDLVVRASVAFLITVTGGLLGDTFLLCFGILMCIGLPAVWKTLSATELARKQDLPPPANDEMPEAAIKTIVDTLQNTNVPTTGAKPLATMALQVYENVMVKPPSWPATFGIWLLYAGGVLVGGLGMLGILFASWGNNFGDEAYPEYETQFQQVTLGEGQFRLGKETATIEGDAMSQEQLENENTSAGRREYENAKRDVLVWQFADNETASNAFESLRKSDAHSVARLDNTVFTSHRPDRSRQDQLSTVEDSFERAEITEQLCVQDPRLDILADETWRRTFYTSSPVMILAVDPALADRLMDQAKSVPSNIGLSMPIGPWTPKATFSEEQLELRKTLRLLQGNERDVPWEVEASEEVDDLWDFSEEAMQDYMAKATERIQRNQASRLKWIQEQAEGSRGTKKELYEVFSKHALAQKAFDDDDRPYEEKDPMLRLDEMLGPLLSKLGYLDDDHPLVATSCRVGVSTIDEETFEYDYAKHFPEPIDGRTVLSIYVEPRFDAAASLACVQAWLKKECVESVYWSYSVPIAGRDE